MDQKKPRCLLFNNRIAIRNTFRGGPTTSPPKDEKPWKKWLNMLVGALRKLARKSFESLPAIVRALLVLY